MKEKTKDTLGVVGLIILALLSVVLGTAIGYYGTAIAIFLGFGVTLFTLSVTSVSDPGFVGIILNLCAGMCLFGIAFGWTLTLPWSAILAWLSHIFIR